MEIRLWYFSLYFFSFVVKHWKAKQRKEERRGEDKTWHKKKRPLGSDRQWKKEHKALERRVSPFPLLLLNPSSAEERDGNSKRVLLISMEIQSFTPPFVPPSLSFPNLIYSFSLSLSLPGRMLYSWGVWVSMWKKKKQTNTKEKQGVESCHVFFYPLFLFFFLL